MASIMHLIVENYNELLESKKDPLVDSWLFMHSPLPVFSILVAYLWFVLYFGPNYMKNRKPFELKSAMIIYNLYQVLFSIWLCSHALNVKNAIPHFLKHTCRNPSPNKEFQALLATGAWWYFFSKITELLDTVFFVMRKKQNQVSFLHVYHHSVTMVGSWAYLKYLPGEQGVVIGFLNSLVHVVMYFYYFLSALGPKYQKYLWWKKYMTWMQLTQFGIMLVYLAFVVVMDCKLPRALTYFFVTNVVIFMYLFADYYRKAYYGKSKKIATSQSESLKTKENGICQHKNGVVVNGKFIENGKIIHENGKIMVRVNGNQTEINQNDISLPKELSDKKKG
ncbi:elongation of very long chain fatty acids protein 7 isoform X2 [Anthonomus grandis grandis]|nr:elongation of very long chain fatty acids protein 7 isoform X2 [Anthonomus grandis grandis]XP_050310554.1 elongation of very long chain fatty acids protein 7 isoform X2 [Anthonomus grandis grandis]